MRKSTYSDSSDMDNDNENMWIDNFMSKSENAVLIKVLPEYIQDRFNLMGIGKYIRTLERSIKVILDQVEDNFDRLNTCTLYYLIHQRYIFGKVGLEDMFLKVMERDYGVCRNINCNSAPLIPMGMSDAPNVSSMKLFCFNCKNIFKALGDWEKVDGCAFGKSFPHFLIMSYQNSFVTTKSNKYVPRIFGFQLYEDTK